MHYIKAKSLLSAANGMNLYRGCQHGCIYCDSRSKCYQMDHPFEDIAVKENGLELLEKSLRAKRQPCMIGTGSMTDPYTPLEDELFMTRRALQLIEKYGFGVAIQTKSHRILRDLDVLQGINRQTKAVVQMTLTTADDRLCAVLEPNVSLTSQRINTLHAFREAGIPTVVWLSPILPFINDTRENIMYLLEGCLDAQVKGIICFNMGLTLREGNREYFFRKLDRHFPGLKQKYIQNYGMQYELNSPRNEALMALFHGFCEKNRIMHDVGQIFRYLRDFPQREAEAQLSLFDDL